MSSQVGFLRTIGSSACPLQQEQRSRERRLRLVPAPVTCRQSQGGGGGGDGLILDRRNVLLALGGAAATATASSSKMVLAAPVTPPDLSKCHDANALGLGSELKCCPPYSSATVYDYEFPATPLRVRRPAHLVKSDEEYMAKYKEAVKKMKELPENHPWNYCQQALIHCAYCNEAYDQVGYPNANVQVHYSWFFLPWHRYYLHFYERILGKLIDDDTFALPYWNFDAEDGMNLPEIFTMDPTSSIYNDKRDKSHYYPAIVDYKYGYANTAGTGETGKDLVQANLSYMSKTFKDSLQLPELFMGDPLRAGEESEKGTGGLETIHNALHQWVGPAESPHTDMGSFATAARDSVFFCLHANVDRLWHLYRGFRGNKLEFNDPDWLESSFLFYDEDEKVVQVKIKDALSTTKLRYTYEEVPIPWMGRVSIKKKAETKEKSTTELSLVRVGEFGSQPRELGTSPLRVLVSRPKKNRKKAEKQDKVEVLQVKDIVVTSSGPARFDVYVATPYGDLAGPDYGDFAGSFVKLPHSMNEKGKMKKKTNLKLGLTSILEDIEADDADKLVVTLVPRVGEITVGNVVDKLVLSNY
ncbi:polyphenol oxidase, chloroplastic-like [Typha latifolia]|uniref:polyphenol oxidase, chloroplastic-like n=1 Tax=Typha latifolia TaxID=4733 RepID=UPI003C30B57A